GQRRVLPAELADAPGRWRVGVGGQGALQAVRRRGLGLPPERPRRADPPRDRCARRARRLVFTPRLLAAAGAVPSPPRRDDPGPRALRVLADVLGVPGC